MFSTVARKEGKRSIRCPGGDQREQLPGQKGEGARFDTAHRGSRRSMLKKEKPVSRKQGYKKKRGRGGRGIYSPKGERRGGEKRGRGRVSKEKNPPNLSLQKGERELSFQEEGGEIILFEKGKKGEKEFYGPQEKEREREKITRGRLPL